MVCDTPPSHAAFTHQIWIPTSKNMRYAPYLIILKTRSEVKGTVTRKWYMTLCHPNMHLHTTFGIPISKNIGICIRLNAVSRNYVRGQVQGHSDPIMLCDTSTSQDASTHQIWNLYLKWYKRYAPDTIILKTTFRGQGQGHSDLKMVRDTPPSQDASTHQIWNSYLKEYRRYAPDMDIVITIETKSEVKVTVTVTRKWYATLCYLKMHPHSKFGIPTSKNIGDMHWTQSGADGRTVRLPYASQSSFVGIKNRLWWFRETHASPDTQHDLTVPR